MPHLHAVAALALVDRNNFCLPLELGFAVEFGFEGGVKNPQGGNPQG